MTKFSEPQKKRTEMSQEELRVYWADQKRIKREKQRSLQSSQLSACSQETQLSGENFFSVFKIAYIGLLIK